MQTASIALAAAAAFAVVYWLTPAPTAVPEPEPARIVEARSAGVEAPGASVVPTFSGAGPAKRRAARKPAVAAYFPGCNAVRAAGLAPLYRGQPGYRPEMDGDDDGIACEPRRGEAG